MAEHAAVSMVSADHLLGNLEGATIVSSSVQDGEGLHLIFQDGRVLVIAGTFALSLMRLEQTYLH